MLHLVTVEIKGGFTTQYYAVVASSREIDLFRLYDSVQPEITGFYYINDAKKTVTRIDFPIPTGSQSAKLTLQSGSKLSGPWTDIADTVVPADKWAEFFRLRAYKP